MTAQENWWNRLTQDQREILFHNYKVYRELRVKRKYRFDSTKSAKELFLYYFEGYRFNLNDLTKEVVTEISKLPVLNFVDSDIDNLYFLYSTKNVRELYLDNCPISEIDFLKHFKQLRKLSLMNISLDRWPYSLEELSELRYLELSESNVQSLHFISNNLKLKEINFHNTDIQYLYDLSNLTELTKLGLTPTRVENLWHSNHV